MVSSLCLLILSQPAGMELQPLPPITLTTGSRAESVVLDVDPAGGITRTVRTDHPVTPLKGTLTMEEHLELQTIAELLPPSKAPKAAPGELNAWRLTLTVGKKSVSTASKEALQPQWAGLVDLLSAIERRLMKAAARKK
ncbi:MAG: hypothetical protein JNJ54_17015 [Myxococcaceae bacterium]|nr:hypothetical protein [Myxococcaceae bacterium]